MRIREPLLWASGLFVALALAAAPVNAKEAPPAKSSMSPPASAKQAADSDQPPPKSEKSEKPPGAPQGASTCKKTSDCPEGMTCTKSGKTSRCTAGPRPIPHVVT